MSELYFKYIKIEPDLLGHIVLGVITLFTMLHIFGLV